jgi:orotidine-5'-phosphate decarboxylase
MGRKFAEIMKEAGVNAAILFPQSGPRTQAEWTHSLFEQGIEVIVGGLMTHPKYLVSEGGNMDDERVLQIYALAAKMGVNNFVVPGTKLDKVQAIRQVIEDSVPGIKPVYWSPGLIAQGGKLTNAAEACGERWQAIIGRGIIEAKDYHAAATEFAAQL